MTKNTYTPLLINNELVVVLNAPEKYECQCQDCNKNYIIRVAECTRYPTLPEDAAYWRSNLGIRMEEGEIGFTDVNMQNWSDNTIYAIPKKQDVNINDAALMVVEELLQKHRSIFDALDIPSEYTKSLLLHFNYSTRY